MAVLFVLSTESGAREDCSVFYSVYLLVDVNPADSVAVDRVKQVITDTCEAVGRAEGEGGTYLYEGISALDRTLKQPIDALKRAGFRSSKLVPQYIVGDAG